MKDYIYTHGRYKNYMWVMIKVIQKLHTYLVIVNSIIIFAAFFKTKNVMYIMKHTFWLSLKQIISQGLALLKLK